MKLLDGSSLSKDGIEELNAHGPYSMAVWTSGDVSIGNEEGLDGRSAYFIELIRSAILSKFKSNQIEKLSILDIGSNDGWVLHQLSDLPFAKMVGVEPREKNIKKGFKVRELLKLSNRVEYRIGDIESIGDEEFDIVICAGVLYHVESIPVALRNIRRACKNLVFIESRCLSDGHITPELMAEIEMRDLAYQFKEKQCGITVQKFESGYHDGSAKSATIVNVPSVDSLVMNLNLLGFENVELVASPEIYRSAVWKDRRPLSGVCLVATVSQEPDVMVRDEHAWINDYEIGLEKEVLPRKIIEPLYKAFLLKELPNKLSENVNNIYDFIVTKKSDVEILRNLIDKSHQGQYVIEIISNLYYSPEDKVSLEYAKLLKYEGRDEDALVILKGVTGKLNADWRSVYRSFHLMSEIYKNLDDNLNYEKYKKLCLTCNPKFPVI